MNLLRKIFEDKKNRYSLILIAFLCIALLIFSDKSSTKENKNNQLIKEKITPSNGTYQSDLEQKLETILSKVYGVGIVDVMITLQNKGEVITKDDTSKEQAKTNEEALSGDKREILSQKSDNTTVKVNGDNALIVQELSPKIEGVLVVAEGGGNIEIKNTIINATKALLDVSTHKIEVLKMK